MTTPISPLIPLHWGIYFDFSDNEQYKPVEWTNLDNGGLVITSVDNQLPQPDYVFVNVPGKADAIDLSRAVSGKISTGQGKLTVVLADHAHTEDFPQYSYVAEMLATVESIRSDISGRPCTCTLGQWVVQSNQDVFVPTAYIPAENATGELFLTEYQVTQGHYEITLVFTYGVDA